MPKQKHEDVLLPNEQPRPSNISDSEKPWKTYLNIAKIVFLTIWWIIILVLIIAKGTVDKTPFILSVSNTRPVEMEVSEVSSGQNVLVFVKGPISVPKFDYALANPFAGEEKNEGNEINLQFERISKNADGVITTRTPISNKWVLEIVNKDQLQSTKLASRSELVEVTTFDESQPNTQTILNLNTNADKLVSISVTFDFEPFLSSLAFYISLVLLLVYFAMVMFDLVHRTLTAMLVCSMAVAILGVVHSRPSIYTMLSWMDMEIFMIQFGMAIVVTFLLRTGVYDWAAVRAYKLSRGHIWPFLYVSIAAVILLSLFFENTGVVLLIGPFFLIVCQMLGVSVIPVVIILTSFLLCGKIGLPFSSILNRRICRHPFLLDNDITSDVYTAHSMPFCVVIIISTFCYFRWVYRDPSKIAVQETEADALKRVIRVLDDTAHGLAGYTQQERKVITQLNKKTSTLRHRLKTLGKMPKPVENFDEKLAQFHSKLGIKNKWLLGACAFPLAFILIWSVLNWFPKYQQIGWVVILAAFFLIIVTGEEDLEELLYHVDWPTLIFLACQQVFTSALDEMSFDDTIGKLTRSAISASNEQRLIVAIIVVFFVSALSALVLDNVGVAQVIVKLVSVLSVDYNLQLHLKPLVWSMIFGLHIGSMGTQISSLTCIVFWGLVERHGVSFPFLTHFKICFPLMLLNSIVSICYLLIVYVALEIS